MRKISFVLIFIFAFAIFPAFAEEVTITTYYPAPTGVYKELRAEEYYGYRHDGGTQTGPEPVFGLSVPPNYIYYGLDPTSRSAGEGYGATKDGSFLKQLYIGNGYVPSGSNAWPLDDRVSLFVKNPSSSAWNCGIYSYTTGDSSFGVIGRIGSSGNLGVGSNAVYGENYAPGTNTPDVIYSCGVQGVTNPPNNNQFGIGVLGNAATAETIGVYAMNSADPVNGRALIADGRVGIGTTNPLAMLSVLDGAVLASAPPSGSVGVTPIAGQGARMMWVPVKRAFRAGYVNGSQWDDANIGDNSIALGWSTTASGLSSFAAGSSATASNDYAVAIGRESTASGEQAVAIGGYQATASSLGAIAIGNNAVASSNGAIAIGTRVQASGSGSMVIGSGYGPSGDYLINANDHSLRVGFGSRYPTLMITDSTGGMWGTGKVYIATDGTGVPGNYKFYVNGPAGGTENWNGSDIVWKKDIQPISGALDKIIELRGVSFEWRKEDFINKNFSPGRQMGVIGQEVEKVFPELAQKTDGGYIYVNYNGFIAPLIEAIKEQQKQIEDLNKKISTIEAKLK